jgi:BatD DUF11 like domain
VRRAPRRPMRRLATGALVLALAAALPTAAAAGDVEVSASLEPQNLAAGDVAVLTLEARGGIFDHVRFEPHFELEGLELAGGPEQSENYAFVDGATAHTFRLRWRLRALAAGPAAVRAIHADFGSARVDVADIRLDVAPGEEAPQPGASGLPFGRGELAAPKVFLRAEATPASPWTGQQVLYSLWVYTQVRVASLALEDAPTFPGFWVDEVPVPDDPRGETVDVEGEVYLRKLLLRRALFPLRPGRFELAPCSVSVLVETPGGDLFRPFLARPVRFSRQSDAVEVEARPLPPAPGGFAGLVGQVTVSSRLDPPDLAVGQAATLDVELTGSGHLGGVLAPRLAPPDGLQVLPPAGTAASAVRGTAVEGSRRWSYALVPQRAGVFRLPPVEVTYFDPEAGAYRVAAGEPAVLRARPADAAAIAEGGPAAGAAGGGPALHAIRSAALPAERSPQWRHLLPWLFALPWGVVLTVALVRRRSARHLGDDPAGRRFADRLDGVREEPRARQAAAEIEGAWRELLVARGLVTADTAAARWRERLAERNADPAGAVELAALVDDLHYLRYAPQLSAVDALRRELIDRSHRLEPRLR